MIVTEHLRRGAARHPDRVAFRMGEVSLTYAEVYDRVERLAGAMLGAGCAPGTTVAILSANDPGAFVCMLAALHAGAAWVPVNVRNGAPTNAAFLARLNIGWLFYHGALAEDAAVIRAVLPPDHRAVRIDGEIDALLAAAPGTLPPNDPRRICTIVGTGGTSGAPKAVGWTETVWAALLATTAVAMPCDVPPVHLCVAPMTHAAGVLAMMLMPAWPTNVVMDRADPLAIMQRIEADRVTHLYLPPTLLYMMLAHPEVRRFDYSSLRVFVIAAAPLAPQRLREAVEVFGPVMAQSYGQAEAPMILTFHPPASVAEAAQRNDEASLVACGYATLLTELAIMAPDGSILQPGEPGEVVARGPLVMDGYLADPDATAETRTHGWHHTGDIGTLTAGGLLTIVDRAKDMVITGGFNVYPAEVERVILGHPAVAECAVIGVPDPKWGEAVKAVVELKQGATVTEAEIIATCRAALGAVKTPKSVEFRATLPRTAVGKVLKRAIRDEYWAGRARAI